MLQNLVVTTPQDLRQLVNNAVVEAISQISFPQKIDPLPVSNFMTLEQACAYLNVAKPTMYGYVCNRIIPFIKKGKKLYFEKKELDAWLFEGRKNTKNQIINQIKPLKK